MAAIRKKKISLKKIDQVRKECERRLILAFRARDKEDLTVKVSNSTREAVKLLRKGASNWTPAEAARAQALEDAEAYMDFIISKSNELEVMDPIPDNFTDDSYWT